MAKYKYSSLVVASQKGGKVKVADCIRTEALSFSEAERGALNYARARWGSKQGWSSHTQRTIRRK